MGHPPFIQLSAFPRLKPYPFRTQLIHLVLGVVMRMVMSVRMAMVFFAVIMNAMMVFGESSGGDCKHQ